MAAAEEIRAAQREDVDVLAQYNIAMAQVSPQLQHYPAAALTSTLIT